MKRILGLDLGTNSIGWAVIKDDDELAKLTGIEMAGSRLIPMDAAQLGKFNSCTSISQTSERTGFRGIRRLNERNLLRRERLLRILELMQFLPEHFSENITRYVKNKGTNDPKIA